MVIVNALVESNSLFVMLDPKTKWNVFALPNEHFNGHKYIMRNWNKRSEQVLFLRWALDFLKAFLMHWF